MSSYSTSERTKQALIIAAGELLAERGVGRVSTRAIAERAGENLGSIHYHFGNKDGLLKEVLRFACTKPTGPSLPEVIQAYMDRLEDVRVQVDVVRVALRYVMEGIFSPERPRWCSRALYQVAQHAGPLRGFLREQMLDPFFNAITGMVHRIRPEWTVPETHLWAYTAIGAIIFHADHGELALERMGLKTFQADYLAKLEQRVVGDALRALGLPTDSIPTSIQSGVGSSVLPS